MPKDTGHCYEGSVQYLLKLKKFDKFLASRCTLCHGIVHGQGIIEGLLYPHAWIEIGEDVMDWVCLEDQRFFGKELFYTMGNPLDVIKYNLEDALYNLIKYKHFGPWTETHNSKFPAYCPWFGTAEDYPTLSKEDYADLAKGSYLVTKFCELNKLVTSEVNKASDKEAPKK